MVTDDRPADALFQCSTNTWQAYNKWPDNHSLYDNDRPDKRPLVSGVRVSFDRPFGKYPQVSDNPLSLGTGEFLLFEFPFAFWLERHGYDVTYCTNADVHASLDTLVQTGEIGNGCSGTWVTLPRVMAAPFSECSHALA